MSPYICSKRRHHQTSPNRDINYRRMSDNRFTDVRPYLTFAILTGELANRKRTNAGDSLVEVTLVVYAGIDGGNSNVGDSLSGTSSPFRLSEASLFTCSLESRCNASWNFIVVQPLQSFALRSQELHRHSGSLESRS